MAKKFNPYCGLNRKFWLTERVFFSETLPTQTHKVLSTIWWLNLRRIHTSFLELLKRESLEFFHPHTVVDWQWTGPFIPGLKRRFKLKYFILNSYKYVKHDLGPVSTCFFLLKFIYHSLLLHRCLSSFFHAIYMFKATLCHYYTCILISFAV